MSVISGETKMLKTRRKIIKAFLELYQDNPFDKINVKAVADLANINRGTFYLHYFDLEELISSIEDEQIDEIIKIEKTVHHLYLSSNRKELEKFFIPFFQYMHDNKYIFKILTSPHSRPNFKDSFRRIIRNNVMEKFNEILLKSDGKELLKKEYVIESIINGNLGMIIHWLQSDTTLSPAELAGLISDTVLKSPLEIMLR